MISLKCRSFVVAVLSATLAIPATPQAVQAHGSHVGDVPIHGLLGAAARAASAQNQKTTARCLVTANRIAAIAQAISYEETIGAGAADRQTVVAPATLGRADGGFNRKQYYPRGTRGTGPNEPYYRAFWHPGVGAYQLDDRGLGVNLTAGQRIDAYSSAQPTATKIAALYCANATRRSWPRGSGQFSESAFISAFGSTWYACQPTGNRCYKHYLALYDVASDTIRDLVRIPVARYGGMAVHQCRMAGSQTRFTCILVDPALSPSQVNNGWRTSPPPTSRTAPLTIPFYSYIQAIPGGGYFEWRVWMKGTFDNVSYPTVQARRRLGVSTNPGAPGGASPDWGYHLPLIDATAEDACVHDPEC